MIKIEKLKKQYGHSLVLEDVNIEISKNGFYVLEGPSGSGKSTLLNILSLMDLDFEGKYFLFGKNVQELSAKEKASYITNQITYLFQEPKFIENESVKTNLELMCNLNLTAMSIENYLKAFSLQVHLDQEMSTLSKGERKRIYLIGAILRNTPLLILDEITSGLDEKNANLLLRKIKKLSESKIVILVTHDLNLVKKYSSSSYHFKNHHLDLIKEEGDDVKKVLELKNNKLNNKYLFFHLEKLVMKKKFRTLILMFSLIITLVTMGLSFLLSDNLKDNITSSLTTYFGTDQILMERRSVGDQSFKNQVVDENEFLDFAKDYDDLIVNYRPLYQGNFENMFVDENDFYLDLNGMSLNLDTYGLSQVNEYLPYENFQGVVYPYKKYSPRVNQIYLGLSEWQISRICTYLHLDGKDYQTLSNYMLNHELKSTLSVENASWEYQIDLPFEVIGFVRSQSPLIISSYPAFSEEIFEKQMQLKYSYQLNEIDEFPWTLKKLPSLVIKEEDLETFYSRMLLDERMNKYLFKKVDRSLYPFLDKALNDLALVYFVYQNQYISISELEKIKEQEKNVVDYLPCGSSFYDVETTSLLSGFTRPLYFSKDPKINDDFIDVNSFSKSNFAAFQGSNFIASNDDFMSMNLVDAAKSNYVKFKALGNSLKPNAGLKPKNANEVVISSGLAKRLNVKYQEKLYFTILQDVKQVGDKYQNIFATDDFLITGIIEDESLTLYQDNIFPLVLMNVNFGIEGNFTVDKTILTLQENHQEHLDTLNDKYQNFHFTNPLKAYLESIEKGLGYLSEGLLIFSLISLISTLFMMILVTYLFLQESEREIGIYSFLGYSKNSIFKLFFYLGLSICLVSFLVVSLTLVASSLIIPLVEEHLSSFQLTFKPFLLIFGVEVFSLALVILSTYFNYSRKDPIEMIKK